MMQGISRKSRRAMRRAKRRRQVWMNIVSMIDILTVLVFFLLMNATGVSILGLNLPSANASQNKPPKHQLTVTLGADALTVADNANLLKKIPRLDDGHYDLDGLRAVLVSVKNQIPADNNIILLMRPNTSYNALVAVMDTVKARPDMSGGGTPIPLFPDISLGDAPKSATATTPASTGAAPISAASTAAAGTS